MVRPGDTHSPEVVRKVQEFLNEREGASLIVSGLYDSVTVHAVKNFQKKYATQILAPWGITEPTGIIYTTTVAKINALMCGASRGCPYFTTLAKPGASNVEVLKIKSFLNMVLGLTLDTSSEILDNVAVAAVRQFQSRYREFILKPWGLSQPTGWWYQTTVRQANKFMGCESGPLTLPNGAVIE
jgi:peptidoglycan hydrolase-like protein with peptidoglycan-binding domain